MNYENLDIKIQELVSQEKFSGCVFISKDNKSLFEKSYGFATKTYQIPNKIDTKFNIASVGKTFTSAAILQLVQNKKINLSDIIDKYIGDLINNNIKNKITIEHLLTHTSGLGDFFDKTSASSRQTVYQKFDDFHDIVKDSAISFTPGEQWSYSNLGFLLLGFIIQRVTGAEYYQYMKKNIFSLVGMNDTGYWFYDEPLENSATGYYYDDTYNIWHCYVNKPVTRGTSAGGCFSTVKDLTLFINSFIAGRIVDNELVKEATTPKPKLNAPGFGYGFFISDNNIGHTGDGTGVNAKMFYFKNGISVAILSNYTEGASEVEKLLDF